MVASEANPQEKDLTSADTQLLLGQLALNRGDGVWAFKWFQAASYQGDARGLNMLGRCFANGWGVSQDEEKAVLYFRRAAELGDAWALFNLGDAYAQGRGVEHNDQSACHFYAEAARHGHIKALNMLGLIYEEGRGMPAQKENAQAFFQAGAEGGDCWAQFNLARLLIDENKAGAALYWLEQALETGFPDFWRCMSETLQEHHDQRLRLIARQAAQRLDSGRPS